MNKDSNILAVVIPAYKPDFLHETLASFGSQANQRFRIYIGDDHGPAKLKEIVEPFLGSMDIVYHRFPDNLGGISLVKQWERCVRLSSEPWVWLFSDDDLAAPDCVEMFYRTVEFTGGRYDVYRYDVDLVGASGEWLKSPPSLPSIISSLELLYHRVVNFAITAAPEHIFSRHAFEREGGFVDFPLAWCSDNASIMRFGHKTGIHIIPGPHVAIRASGLNISTRQGLGLVKTEAVLAFMKWFKEMTDGAGGFDICNEHNRLLLEVTWQNFPRWFYNRLYYDGFPLSDRVAVLELRDKIINTMGARADGLLTPLAVHLAVPPAPEIPAQFSRRLYRAIRSKIRNHL